MLSFGAVLPSDGSKFDRFELFRHRDRGAVLATSSLSARTSSTDATNSANTTTAQTPTLRTAANDVGVMFLWFPEWHGGATNSHASLRQVVQTHPEITSRPEAVRLARVHLGLEISGVNTTTSTTGGTPVSAGTAAASQHLHVKTAGRFVPLQASHRFVGLLGFVRFVKGYYMVVVPEVQRVGAVGGHNVFQPKTSDMIPLFVPAGSTSNTNNSNSSSTSSSINSSKRNGNTSKPSTFAGLLGSTKNATDVTEERYKGLFTLVDLTKAFYLSYSYNITQTVQNNIAVSQPKIQRSKKQPVPDNNTDHDDHTDANSNLRGDTRTSADEDGTETPSAQVPLRPMFEWNRFLSAEFMNVICTDVADSVRCRWIVQVIHGSFGQQNCTLLGHSFTLTLIARRSRHFAGTRYLKRGLNDDGYVANDCEIEQVVESITCPAVSAFLQMRGSIPTHWTQETSLALPKPPIKQTRVDPFFAATRLHFADLMGRYGEPVVILNLVKQYERTPRESIIGFEYKDAVRFLNASLPAKHRLRYFALDFARVSKSTRSSVLRAMDDFIKHTLCHCNNHGDNGTKNGDGVHVCRGGGTSRIQVACFNATVHNGLHNNNNDHTPTHNMNATPSVSNVPSPTSTSTSANNSPYGGELRISTSQRMPSSRMTRFSSSSTTSSAFSGDGSIGGLPDVNLRHHQRSYYSTCDSDDDDMSVGGGGLEEDALLHAMPLSPMDNSRGSNSNISVIGSRTAGLRGRCGSSSAGGSDAFTWSDRTLRFEPLLSFPVMETHQQEQEEEEEQTQHYQNNDGQQDFGAAASVSGEWSTFVRQQGIVRTNCVDGLDRTNVAQFLIGVDALGQQLFKCGISPQTSVATGSSLLRLLMDMYEMMGDRIAQQYAGSSAHHKGAKVLAAAAAGSSGAMEGGGANVGRSSGGGGGGGGVSRQREIVTSVRRYYSNSFTDRAKQDAINLFLGVFVPPSMFTAATHDISGVAEETSASRRGIFSRSKKKFSGGGGSSIGSNNTDVGGGNSNSNSSIVENTHVWDLESDYYLHNHASTCGASPPDAIRPLSRWWRAAGDKYRLSTAPNMALPKTLLTNSYQRGIGEHDGQGSNNNNNNNNKSTNVAFPDVVLSEWDAGLSSFDSMLGEPFARPLALVSFNNSKDERPESLVEQGSSVSGGGTRAGLLGRRRGDALGLSVLVEEETQDVDNNNNNKSEQLDSVSSNSEVAASSSWSPWSSLGEHSRDPIATTSRSSSSISSNNSSGKQLFDEPDEAARLAHYAAYMEDTELTCEADPWRSRRMQAFAGASSVIVHGPLKSLPRSLPVRLLFK